jgi:predicted secreted hydrolase
MLYRLMGLFLSTLIVFSSVYAQEGEKTGRADEVYTFPRDHYFHADDPIMSENYLEWFYYTGILHDATEQLWGYQVTIFHASPAYAQGRKIYLYDVALSDSEASRFLHYRGFWVDAGQVSNTPTGWAFDNGILQVSYDETTDTWRNAFDGTMEDTTTHESHDVQFDLTLANTQSDYYRHADNGVSAIGECQKDEATLEGYTYYYTHPALATAGTLTLNGATLDLAGDTWFDHQWGNFVHCALAWDWFSLRLDDGSYIMIFALLDQAGNPLNLLGMTYINPEGNTQHWYGDDDVQLTAIREWMHPDTGVSFPIEWQVGTPVGQFYIEPVLDAQAPGHLEAIPDYWEGMVKVYQDNPDGELLGLGYLEVAR